MLDAEAVRAEPRRSSVIVCDLRAALERSGLTDVRTYIQSGNVLFRTDHPVSGDGDVATSVASTIAAASGLAIPVVVRRLDDIRRMADSHPDSGGDVPDKWLHVFVLDQPADPSLGPEPERFAPDRWTVDGREIYATYPIGSGRSKLTIDVMERAFGVTATARNVSTLRAIAELGAAGS